jgi:hypothetical protein
MIKSVVTPQNTEFIITIPSNYIGKKVEILVYALDEIEEKKSPQKKSLSDYCGILSENEYLSLNAHIEQTRAEWDRRI